jgi:NADPH-dependent 2,4-dienoyl-CoA reductase/sulfur reductase-like enzyme
VDSTVYVVGAGPAGLAVAAALMAHGVQPRLLERGSGVGANWRTRYDGLQLNTVRWLSHLPGQRIPARAGRWVGRDDFVDYLERYAHSRRLRVETGVELKRVERGRPGDTRWRLHTSAGELDAAAVVIATGAFDIPVWPRLPGFTGELCHAVEYRNPTRYLGRHVLVIGAGASGLEIATLLADGGAGRVDLAVRSCQNLFTRQWRGLPLTPPPAAQRLPTQLLDAGGWMTQRLLGRGWPDPLPRPVAGLGTALRRDGQEPIVADGVVEALRAGRIRLLPGVTGARGPELLLDDASTVRPDAVIAATGYIHALDTIVGHLGVLGANGVPPVTGAGGGERGLVFVGFEPTVTGRLVQIRRQTGQAVRAVLSALS